ITGVYARLAATKERLSGRRAGRDAHVPGEPYLNAEAFLADLKVIDESLRGHRGARLADSRLKQLLRAVDVFGFHLTAVDQRQNSDVHARVVHELLAEANVHADYQGLDETRRVALLMQELSHTRPLHSPFVDYSAETRSE